MKLFAIVFGLEQEGKNGKCKCGEANEETQFAGSHIAVCVFDSVYACGNAEV